ncbi:MAG: GNAT family N-acetyltransferase [bacterium]|nr:GNAT family N-acetyltransferase [bacterium]
MTIIRKMDETEYHLLEDFLYLAIFIPKGEAKPSRDIIYDDDLYIYISGFGKEENDFCMVAVDNDKVIGACWCRIMDDYGHIDNNTPSMAISVLEEYRNQGIGTKLLTEFLNELRNKGYKRISLSVQKENYALNMYIKCGFKIYMDKNEEYIMLCNL